MSGTASTKAHGAIFDCMPAPLRVYCCDPMLVTALVDANAMALAINALFRGPPAAAAGKSNLRLRHRRGLRPLGKSRGTDRRRSNGARLADVSGLRCLGTDREHHDEPDRQKSQHPALPCLRVVSALPPLQRA